MVLGRVVGNVISTVKHPAYEGTKLALVQPILPDGTPKGNAIIAVDVMCAGEGEIVLVVREGDAAAKALGLAKAPVRSIILGIVDRIDVNGEEQT